MKPATARVLMTVIILGYVIAASVFVNSRFHGSFAVGLIVIIVPFLVLSFSLPYLLPVRCVRCGGKMHFHFKGAKRDKSGEHLYAYVCECCDERHEWEGASSGPSLD